MRQACNLYTALTADISSSPSIEGVPEGVRCVCFTDHPGRVTAPWQVAPLQWRHPDPQRVRAFHKTHPMEFFSGKSASIWIDPVEDAAAAAVRRINQLGEQPMEDLELRPARVSNCLYQYGSLLLEDGYPPERLSRQLNRYWRHRFPQKDGLYATDMVGRVHNEAVSRLNAAWWSEIRRYSAADGVSLPFVLHRMGLPVSRSDSALQ